MPKFYLKGFADKQGMLWVYEKGKNAPRASKPKAEANRENYYVFTDRGTPDDGAEKLLSKVESIVAPTIRKLANPQFKMNDQQRGELYAFVALMFVRVPAYREFIDKTMSEMMKRFAVSQAKDSEKFYGAVKEMEAETGKPLADVEKLRAIAMSGDYEVTQASVGFNLLMIFQTSLKICEVFETQYRHDIIYAPPGTFFPTSDNPIATLEPDTEGRASMGGGITRPGNQVIFPLNKRACLILRRNGKEESLEAAPGWAAQIRDAIMASAQKHLYAVEGKRRIARIFTERGCQTKYGVNSLLPDPRFSAPWDR